MPSALRDGARGGGLVLLGSGVSLVIQLVSLVVLSRLLTPSDFGLVAMVAVFVVLGNLLRDFGLPMAGLQMQTLSHQQASNLFWMNAGVAALTALTLALATPLITALYGDERLRSIVPVFAVVILISGMGAQVQVNLARRGMFRAIVLSDVAAQLCGLAIAVCLAVSGAGYWALVLQSVIAALITVIVRWIAAQWRPSVFRRGHGSRRLLRVGAEYGFAQILSFFQGNIDTLVIGSQLGAASLGYYNRAFQILTAPASRMLDPLTQVVVPTLNRIRATGGTVWKPLEQIQVAIGAAVVWVFSVAAGVAPQLLPAVLGPGWQPTVQIFQVLAIGGCFWVFNHVSYWIFIAHERSRELLHYNLVSKPIAIVIIASGVQFGAVGVAGGYALAMALSWPLNLAWLSRSVGLDAIRFAANGCVLLLAGVACGTVSLGASGYLSFLPSGASVLGGIVAGTVAMLGVCVAVPRTRRHLIAAKRSATGYLRERRLRAQN